MAFALFMASAAGRLVRVAAGLAMLGIGYSMHTTGGTILAVVGLLPLAAGALDICALGPLFGAPLRGADVRANQG